MSEERTWNSEDTQPCSFKAFFALGRLLHGQCTDSQHLRLLACLEVECIVFAMEGLLLTHDLRSTEGSGLNHIDMQSDGYSNCIHYSAALVANFSTPPMFCNSAGGRLCRSCR